MEASVENREDVIIPSSCSLLSCLLGSRPGWNAKRNLNCSRGVCKLPGGASSQTPGSPHKPFGAW